MAMLDEDQETLAAEYVLGTLSAEEREHAEALLTFDPGFEAAVHQWERRLGELNVMVEAVEPPAELWDKIKQGVSPAATNERGDADAVAAAAVELPQDLDTSATVAALAFELSSLETPAHEPETPPLVLQAPAAPEPVRVERSADVIYLARRVRRWQRLTYALGAIAALLAIYVAVSQTAPDLIPARLRPAGGAMVARSDVNGRLAQDRLVAVLQQGPTAPAFLLTLDTRQRTLVVRRVSAKPEAGKSYELWLISSRFPAPRSLGVVAGDEYTERPIPGNFDVDTLRAASYAVSLEPNGGSPSGAPTGPVLFTGKAVESLPATPPASTTRG